MEIQIACDIDMRTLTRHQVFGPFLGQIFDQILGQCFWIRKYSVQFYWARKYSVQFYWDRKYSVQFYWDGNTMYSSTGSENTVYSSTGTETGYTLTTIVFLTPTKKQVTRYILMILQNAICL